MRAHLQLILFACVACGDGGGSEHPSVDAAAAPEEYYAILAKPQLAADSTVRNRVIVVGTHADGTLATDQIVLNTDRPGAGTFADPVLTLGALGAETTFSTCNLVTPGCAGPVTLTAAFASAPGTPIATRAIELVPPIDVNPAKQCLTGGNMLVLDGNDQVFSGQATVSGATWTFESTYAERVIVRVTPAGGTDYWRLMFDSSVYAPFLVPDVYLDAQGPTGEIDHPRMDVSGYGKQCALVTGEFEITEIAVDGNGVAVMTVAFEQHCEGSTTTGLRGCVHYQR